jgi:hypothetical protein
MLRPLVAAALLVLSLSGCSSGPETQGPTTPGPTFTATAQPVADQVVRTDTMHFLDAPHMTGSVPTASEPLRVPLKPIAANDPRSSIVVWSLPRPQGLGLLEVEFHLFIEVEGTFVNADPGGGDCFWNATLHVRDADSSTWIVECGAEGPLVQPGIRELRFVGQNDISQVGGGELQVELLMAAPPTPGAAAFLLTGTPDHDSSLTIAGLQLPIDTQTLLL